MSAADEALCERARGFAFGVHAGEPDPGAGREALAHVERVARACVRAHADSPLVDTIVQAAWLHDVCENHPHIEPRVLRDAGFPPVVVEAVELLTMRGDDSGAFVEAIASAGGDAGAIARAVKRADLADNLDPPEGTPSEEKRRRLAAALERVGGVR